MKSAIMTRCEQKRAKRHLVMSQTHMNSKVLYRNILVVPLNMHLVFQIEEFWWTDMPSLCTDMYIMYVPRTYAECISVYSTVLERKFAQRRVLLL